MSVFSQLRNPNKSVSDDREVVNDFERRTPYWSYRTVNYKPYEPFLRFKEDIDGYLKRLFDGEIDDGNGDVLDNMIMDMARQAEKDLARQHMEHRDLIMSFEIRAKSDEKAFRHELELLKERLEDAKRKQEKYRILYEEGEFIERRKKK